MNPAASSQASYPNTIESASSNCSAPSGVFAPEWPYERRRSITLSLSGILAILLILGFIGVIVFYSYIAWLLARPAAAPLESDPLHAAGLSYETVTFASLLYGHSLEGWYIPAPAASDRTVVFSHGYGGNREEIWVPIYELARFVHEQGYNALMFDYGYVYHSDRIVTGGAQESLDLLGAVQYAKSRGAEEIVVWGFSMGAGTALQSALSSDLFDAMILDSTFVLEPDTLYHNLSQYAALPREPSLTLLHWLYPLLNGSGMSDVPYREIKTAEYGIPVLMIHGTRDERSPYDKISEIAFNQTASHSLSQFWLVPNATHELIYRYHKEEYIARTTAFLRNITK